MELLQQIVLVLDGHDGSGKTTLAVRLAEELCADYIKPFSGKVGEHFQYACEQGDLAFASELAHSSVQQAINRSDAPVLVFDRHWMTAFSMLPEEYWLRWWPLPPTTLCWASLETTIARLASRRWTESESYDHDYYLSIYHKLAERFGCQVLRTDQLSLEESLERLLAWANLFTQHNESF